MAVVGFIFILLPGSIARAFTGDEGVVTLAALYLFIFGFSKPALGAFFTLVGGMRGAGYTEVPMFINFMGLIVIRLSLSYSLGFLLGLDLFGVWLEMALETFFRS